MESNKKEFQGDACGPRYFGLRFAPVLPDDGQELPLRIAIANNPAS